MQRTAPLILLSVLVATANAQSVTVKKVELAGENIKVYYDLDDSNPNNEYHISLFSSANDFSSAAVKVAGDVGTEIKPGVDKVIEWHAKQELGAYKGRISLEIRAKIYMPIVKSINIAAGEKFKRSKSHTITWKTSNNNPVNIELYHGGSRVMAEFNQQNNGKFELLIPAHARPAKNYTLRITDSHNPNESAQSKSFRVTRRVPLLLKAVPLLIAGGVAAFYGNKPGEPVEKIPDPPMPQNGN